MIITISVIWSFLMANKKHIRLNSARDAHKLLSKMINERRRKEIGGQECRDIGYLLRILLDSIEAGELEDRIENLEKPQEELEIKYPLHSEQDELRIIAWLRKQELEALNPPPVKEVEESEGVEIISEISND